MQPAFIKDTVLLGFLIEPICRLWRVIHLSGTARQGTGDDDQEEAQSLMVAPPAASVFLCRR